jgi:mono/diheme cytochrome c family protein
MNRIQSAFLLAGILAFSGFLLSSFSQQSSTKQRVQEAASFAVSDPKAPDTPAPSLQGPSWLKHLGLSVSQTQMGKMGGSGAPPATADNTGRATLKSNVERFLNTFRSNPEQASQILNDKFIASGADLYRWNCQGCHGPEGKGAPPEINSIIGPVQGTSAELAKKRMEARGIDADDEMITQMTELAATSLRDRLQHGGKSMPAFAYLRSDEVDALLGYLEKLAGVPPTKRAGLLVPQSVSTAGEHIARGTCHICHDATGQEAGTMMMMHRGIPSLASIPRERSLSGVVHQVQFGSSGMMKMMGNEVMPAYPYLSEEEIAAVYFAAYSVRP